MKTALKINEIMQIQMQESKRVSIIQLIITEDIMDL